MLETTFQSDYNKIKATVPKEQKEREERKTMEILNQYGVFTKTEIFNACMKGGELLKNQPAGLIMDVDRLVVVMDKKTSADGTERVNQIMHIFTTSGDVYTTESPTLQETVLKAVDFMETHKLKFVLQKKRSKNNREFMDVDLIGVNASIDPGE